jgi:oxidase EvaA
MHNDDLIQLFSDIDDQNGPPFWNLRNSGDAVHRICLAECRDWSIRNGVLVHSSGRYFSVCSIEVDGNESIIIDQPEVGILAFLYVGNPGNLRWLVQLKPEPGNVGLYQVAPTVQATKSNYERVHNGKSTPFLNLVADSTDASVDVEGSEQGDRFLGKFNRNIKRIVSQTEVEGEVRAPFFWLNNAMLKQALRQNFAVNTDARSVLASGRWDLLADAPGSLFTGVTWPETPAQAWRRSYELRDPNRIREAEQLLLTVHMQYGRRVARRSLDTMKHHHLDAFGVVDRDEKRLLGYFGVDLPEREVSRWQQPLFERESIESCVLLFHYFDGVAYLNVAAYPEIGWPDHTEFGPSIHTGEGVLKCNKAMLNSMSAQIDTFLDIQQSDEGGRFFRNVNHYSIGHWRGSPQALSPDLSIWLTAGELEELSSRRGILSNECRTCLSLLLSVA